MGINKKIIIIDIVHALFITAAFSVIFFYGVSGKTYFLFIVLTGVPGVGSRIIEGALLRPIENRPSKATISSWLKLLNIILIISAVLVAFFIIDEKSRKLIFENKAFLIIFWMVFMSGLASDYVEKLKRVRNNAQPDI